MPRPPLNSCVHTDMAMVLTVKFTSADYEALAENFPIELIEGRFIRDPSPAYGHQRIVGNVFSPVRRHVGRSRAVVSPIDVFLGEHNILQPDILVLDRPLGPKTKHAELPALVVEVLSPSTIRRDRQVKRRIYLEAGVREVWIVDPESETVEIFTRSGQRSFGLDDPLESAVVPEFRLPPRSLLRE